LSSSSVISLNVGAIAHTTLGKFDDLLGYHPRCRFIGQFHPEFPAYGFERKRHLPDEFRLERLTPKEWPYWHGLLDIAD
jgi:hypothetical protein